MSRCLVITLMLLLIACSPPPAEPLRIAINPWPGFEYLYLAEQLKLFEAEGVQVKILQFGSAHDSGRAYQLGQADGYCTTTVGVLLSREQSGRQPQIVHVTDYSSGGDLIIAQAAIDDLSQLAGKRVGIEPNTLNSYILARALNTTGLKVAELSLVNLAQSNMFEALQTGEIDAAVTYPPFSVEMLKQPQLKEIFNTRAIPGEVLDVIAIDASVLATRKSEVQAMLRALEAAQQYAQAHPDEANRIMAARENLKPEEFANIVRNDLQLLRAADQQFYYGTGQRLMKALESSQEVLLANKELLHPTDLNLLIAP
jgi:NitT/TauT family transport system substrate-binding protein